MRRRNEMAEETKVLIVDDDVEFADSLKDILDAEGHKTQTANNGLEAIVEVEDTAFDIILMDIKMPVMNGVELLKRVKKLNTEIVVIMMTAFSVEDLINDAKEEGAFGVLHKPLDIKKLLEMIELAKTGNGLIMIADDDLNARDTLKDVFEEKGYSVSLASNSDEAIRMAKEEPTNIIFLDIKFSPLNGLETYLLIREVNPKVVVVLMTAHKQEMKGLVEEALQKSVYTCLYKPFDLQEAVNVAEEIIRQKNE